jgi:hypothetical protein
MAADVGTVRERLIIQSLAYSDAQRELDISRLAAEIEYLGPCARAAELGQQLAALVAQRPAEYIARLERALGYTEEVGI